MEGDGVRLVPFFGAKKTKEIENDSQQIFTAD